MLCKLDDLLEDIMEGWLLILEITQICLQCLAISLRELWAGCLPIRSGNQGDTLTTSCNFFMDMIER